MFKYALVTFCVTALSFMLLVSAIASFSIKMNADAIEKPHKFEPPVHADSEVSLEQEMKMQESAIEHLQKENAELKNEILILQETSQKSKGRGGDHFGDTEPYDYVSTISSKLSILDRQTAEVLFNRELQVYNYKNGELHNFSWSVPYSTYANYRNDHTIHGIPTLKGMKSVEYYEKALSSWHELDELARGLRGYSGGDDELYANIVLQVAHQIMFTPADYTKHPIETFVEGTGDCDSIAVFAAALLKAGGLDSALIFGKAVPNDADAPAIGHALVGVKLDEKPDDHRTDNYTIIEGQDVYYAGEPTWEKGIFEDPWNYEINGSAFGEITWKEFSGTVVKTPDRPTTD